MNNRIFKTLTKNVCDKETTNMGAILVKDNRLYAVNRNFFVCVGLNENGDLDNKPENGLLQFNDKVKMNDLFKQNEHSYLNEKFPDIRSIWKINRNGKDNNSDTFALSTDLMLNLNKMFYDLGIDSVTYFLPYDTMKQGINFTANLEKCYNKEVEKNVKYLYGMLMPNIAQKNIVPKEIRNLETQ